MDDRYSKPRDLEWRTVEHSGADGCTERLEVPGGWLYRSWLRIERGEYIGGLAFVPAPRGQ